MKLRLSLLPALLALVIGVVFSLGGSASAKTMPPHVGSQPVIHPVNKGGRFGSAAAPTVGEVLTTTNGDWGGSGLSFAWQWQDCNSSGLSCVNISGATSSTYTIVSGDTGDTISVTVTATNSGGSASQSSAVTGVVTTNLPVELTAPSLSGTATEGDQITLIPGTFSNETTQDGVWEQCPSASSMSCTATANTGTTYTLGSGDVGLYIRLMETATNTNGNTVVWSNAIGPIASSGGGGGGGGGFSGTCNATISPSTTSNAVGHAESLLSAGQVLCLNSGSYGSVTTPSGCVASNNSSCSGVNANRYTASGTSGSPIIVTSGPGQTATIQGANEVIGSWVTLENLNIDESNQISKAISSPVTAGANPVPPCNVSVTGKSEAIEFESGTHDTLLDNNIYQSLASTREIDIFITAGNVTIENNNISNAGSCGQTEHLIYDDAGSGTIITQNWFFTDQFGYGVQLYPNPGTTTVSSNVIDGTLDGFVDDSSVGGNTVTHNVVINPISNNAIISGQNSASSSGGAFQTCFHDQSGATDTQANNAIFNASAGFGCSSESGIAISGQTTLSNNPFVGGTTTPGKGVYTLCVTVMTGCTSGQVTAATTVAGYGLWDGSGTPSPNPALSLTSSRFQPVAVTAPHPGSGDPPWALVVGGLLFGLAIVVANLAAIRCKRAV